MLPTSTPGRASLVLFCGRGPLPDRFLLSSCRKLYRYFSPTKQIVISTEASHSPIVTRGAEKSASLSRSSPSHQPPSAVACSSASHQLTSARPIAQSAMGRNETVTVPVPVFAFAVVSLCRHSERSEESQRVQHTTTLGIFHPQQQSAVKLKPCPPPQKTPPLKTASP
jgi:hypothetical protein